MLQPRQCRWIGRGVDACFSHGIGPGTGADAGTCHTTTVKRVWAWRTSASPFNTSVTALEEIWGGHHRLWPRTPGLASVPLPLRASQDHRGHEMLLGHLLVYQTLVLHSSLEGSPETKCFSGEHTSDTLHTCQHTSSGTQLASVKVESTGR